MATYSAQSQPVDAFDTSANDSYYNLYYTSMDVTTGTVANGKITLNIKVSAHCGWATSKPYGNFHQDLRFYINGDVLDDIGYVNTNAYEPVSSSSWKSNTTVNNHINKTYYQTVVLFEGSYVYEYGCNKNPTITFTNTYYVRNGNNYAYVPGSEMEVSVNIPLPFQAGPYNVELSSQNVNDYVPSTEIWAHMRYSLSEGTSATAVNMYYRKFDLNTYEPLETYHKVNVTLDEDGCGIISGLTPDTVYEVTCSVTANGNTIYTGDDGDACSIDSAAWSVMTTATQAPTLVYTYSIEEDDIGEGPWKITVDISGSTIPSPNQGLDYKIASIYGTEIEETESRSVLYNIPEETEMYIQIGVTARSSNVLSTQKYDGVNLTFTTPAVQAKAYTRQGNSWSLGKVYFKTGDTWVKAKKIYVKEGGIWKGRD